MLRVSIIVALLCAWLPGASARTLDLDRGLRLALDEYLLIQHKLATDSELGITRSARVIRRLMKRTARQTLTARDRWLVDATEAAARVIAQARGLTARRRAFAQLSRPMLVWAARSAEVRKTINIVHSRRARAAWLQRGRVIENPYLGPKMVRSGHILGGPHRGHYSGLMDRCKISTPYELLRVSRVPLRNVDTRALSPVKH